MVARRSFFLLCFDETFVSRAGAGHQQDGHPAAADGL